MDDFLYYTCWLVLGAAAVIVVGMLVAGLFTR